MSKLALNLMPGRCDCLEYYLYPTEETQMLSYGIMFPNDVPLQDQEPINFIVYVPEELRGLTSLDLEVNFIMEVHSVCFFDTDFYTYKTAINGRSITAVASDLNPTQIYVSDSSPGFGGFYMYRAIFDIGPMLTSDVEYFEMVLTRAEDEPEHTAWFVLASTDPEVQEV